MSPRDPANRTAFYLVSDDEVDIFPQGPLRNDRVPSADRLVAPGQRLLGERAFDGVTLVELAYEHAGRDWWQGHHMVPVGPNHTLVFTAQAPAASAASAMSAVAALLGKA